MSDAPLPLLNIFEVPDEDGLTRHLLAFLEPTRAESAGIEPRCIVGDIEPTAEGGLDAATLRVNPEFVGAIAAYMNEVQAGSPDLAGSARALAPGRFPVVDPRNPPRPDVAPPPGDIVGTFAVDDSGRVVPGSFSYNQAHALIDPELGISALFSDRKFYDWLHPTTGTPQYRRSSGPPV